MSPSTLLEIRRYPVKAMGGESLESAELDARGLVGDRAYAVVDAEGKLATGKHSRRFRRRDEVFEFASHTTAGGVRVRGRDHELAAPGEELDRFLSEVMGDDVQVLPETTTPYFDAEAVSLIGTASLAWCREHLGVDADRRRIRSNLLVETDVPFVEETWSGTVAVGGVRLRPVERIERCRMIDIAQEGLPADGRWLKALAETRELSLGIYLAVERPGRIVVGDEVRPEVTGSG
ncbi:MAG: MOSC domain-containing protein [Nocardioides sp.]